MILTPWSGFVVCCVFAESGHGAGLRTPHRPAVELRLGRIDTLHLRGLAALDEQLGEGPIAATHVDPSLARRRRQPIEEDAHTSLLQTAIIRS